MKPSLDDGDAVLEAVVDGEVVAQLPFMVRVRKTAESLTDRERDRSSAPGGPQQPGSGRVRRVLRDARLRHQRRGARPRALLPGTAPSCSTSSGRCSSSTPRWRCPTGASTGPCPGSSADFIGAPVGPRRSVRRSMPRLSPGQPVGDLVDRRRGRHDRHPCFADPGFSPAISGAGPVRDTDELADAADGWLDYAYKDVVRRRTARTASATSWRSTSMVVRTWSFSGAIRFIETAPGDRLFFMLHCDWIGSGRCGTGARKCSTARKPCTASTGATSTNPDARGPATPAGHHVALERRRTAAGRRPPLAAAGLTVVAGRRRCRPCATSSTTRPSTAGPRAVSTTTTFPSRREPQTRRVSTEPT